MLKKLIKMYIKSIPKKERSLRTIFVGKRLKEKQYNWLHFSNHPWEKK